MTNKDEDKAFGELLRRRATRHAAPGRLRSAIRQQLAANDARPSRALWPRWLQWEWLRMGGAFAAGALCMLLLLPLGLGKPADTTAEQLVDGHIRSLLGSHLIDVAASEQQTVKPWLVGKLDYAPPVNDFTQAGYQLAGARLDVVEGHVVAALVYKHGQHLINVYEMPNTGGTSGPAEQRPQRGFNVVRWSKGGMACWAVSDLNVNELKAFGTMHWHAA